jgi:predicted nuclease of predicted toxin-antitoxin system
LKFKIDQNLPAEYATLLRQAGFEAHTVENEGLNGADDLVVSERSRAEGRTLITLDLGFSDIRTYPPQAYPGIVVLRSKAQDKITLISMLKRVITVLGKASPAGQLWIVERDRIRYRED